ncbi:MAG TPA: diphosphomevalonate decarboxylase [Bacteroidetes bacterium]|nr:diphosphomevalonate decarboxylase [Bacteroidota bacterium]
MEATAIAHTNIALIKYWGKKDEKLNLPAVGSISITLKQLFTQTKVRFSEKLQQDFFILNGLESGEDQRSRVSRFLDLNREIAGSSLFAEVISNNNFPTGAGLASSASGFAALSLAANKALGLNLSQRELTIMARRGSGSAARSVYGGFVEMKTGGNETNSDAYAVQIADESYWPLKMLIAITSDAEKKIGSTDGMKVTAKTSPYYSAWLASSVNDLAEMRTAIARKDFKKLGALAENSCLKMHGLALSAKSGLIYWNGATLNVMHAVREMRKNNLQAYFTVDAGPQVKVICEEPAAAAVKEELAKVDGVMEIIFTGLGPDAKIIGEEEN